MEKTPASCLFSLQLVSFIILESVICFFIRLIKLSRRYLSFLGRSLKAPRGHSKEETRTEVAGMVISREEVELVMEKMGLVRGVAQGDEQLKEFLGVGEVASMFEEKEPSLEEVKEAFAVFDENGDGFVDAGELQRVLWKLGFKDEVGLNSCMKMIGEHDENGDGMMDFGDFVKFMESSFCS